MVTVGVVYWTTCCELADDADTSGTGKLALASWGCHGVPACVLAMASAAAFSIAGGIPNAPKVVAAAAAASPPTGCVVAVAAAAAAPPPTAAPKMPAAVVVAAVVVVAVAAAAAVPPYHAL